MDSQTDGHNSCFCLWPQVSLLAYQVLPSMLTFAEIVLLLCVLAFCLLVWDIKCHTVARLAGLSHCHVAVVHSCPSAHKEGCPSAADLQREGTASHCALVAAYQHGLAAFCVNLRHMYASDMSVSAITVCPETLWPPVCHPWARCAQTDRREFCNLLLLGRRQHGIRRRTRPHVSTVELDVQGP